MNPTLPKERLATTDETGKRIYLYPADVRGFFRNRRQVVHFFLVVIFLLLPWLRWDHQQLLLLDVARREFFFFGLHFRATDAPLLLFLVLAFVFLLGFVTAVWGRVWCGWACPQTVFTDFLFRRIERWIEGAPRARRELDASPLTREKLVKRTLKWGAFTLISLVFTHSFLAYFVGSHEVLGMLRGSPTENWQSFLVVMSTTALVLFDFGWFREQFCIIACPYGRMQSVMLDEHSTVVGYDTKRGEPRRGLAVPAGDCVDCLRCVQVCPTGIDIRRGLQMECIACTACIDACDEVMTKTKRPLGLIRYASQTELATGQKKRQLGVRTYAFGGLFLAVVLGLVLSLTHKDFLDVAVLRAQGSPYELTQFGGQEQILNHFRLDLSNQTGHDTLIELALDESVKQSAVLVIPMNPFPVARDANQRLDFFVRFPKALLEKGTHKTILHIHTEGHDREQEINLVGPDA